MNEQTMKKLLISAVVLATLAALPAHAISQKYREQLERSGCTQVTDGNGCDITKSKEWNRKHAPVQAATSAPTAKQQYSQIVGEAETLPGMKGARAESYLTGHGWRQAANGDWSKAGHTLRLVEEDGIVLNAQIIQ